MTITEKISTSLLFAFILGLVFNDPVISEKRTWLAVIFLSFVCFMCLFSFVPKKENSND